MDRSGYELFRRWGEVLTAVVVLAATVLALFYLLPPPVVALGAAVVGLAIGVFGFAFAVFRYGRYVPDRLQAVPVWVILLVPLLLTVGFLVRFDIRFSPLNGVLFAALLLLITVYWLVIPLSLYQHYAERHREASVEEWPTITALVPAYNERGYVGRCIDSFLEADYPAGKLDVVVVDDGSTDGTFAEAKRRAGETVTVLRKDNGGKHSALNYALEGATSELVVTVDADSRIDEDALKQLVRSYRARPNTSAVAGNVKVANRDSRLTRVQALEYIVSINMYRRALDHLGLVKVVPGCLGLFDRSVIEDVGGYSGDTVTEDFDLTMALHKAGGRVHYSGTALVRTEAPETLTDFYRQRVRWLRGSVQTVRKHRDVLVSPEFGVLHGVLAPLFVLSIAVVPAFGVVILGAIAWMALFGSVLELLGLFALFASLQTLFATLAILIEKDVETESLWLALYAPLTVVGYKQHHDVLMLKSLADVLLGGEMPWTRAGRARQRTGTDGFAEAGEE